MEWKIFDIEGDEEGFFQWVLLTLAGAFEYKESPCPGYTRTVREDLLPSLRFLKAPTDRRPLWGPLRLYASLGRSRSLALLCGEALEGPVDFLRKQQESSFTLRDARAEPAESNWGLIGVTFPGWVILFSEDVEEACRDRFNDGFSVAYLPAGSVSLSLLDPELPAEEALQLLFVMLLQSLPLRESAAGNGPSDES